MVDFHISQASLNKKAFFLDLSKAKSRSWQWFVNGKLVSNKKNTAYIFNEPGINYVTLKVINDLGITFSQTKEINVYHSIKKKAHIFRDQIKKHFL